MAIANFMSVGEAARELGITDGRVRQLLRAGNLIGEHLNGSSGAWVVYRASVLKFKKLPQITGRPRIGQKSS